MLISKWENLLLLQADIKSYGQNTETLKNCNTETSGFLAITFYKKECATEVNCPILKLE
jgi:hypothetical protein